MTVSLVPRLPRHHRFIATNTSISKTAGVKSHDVSLENQSATVVADPALEYDTVLRAIAKTGKKINSAFADGVEKSVEVPAVAA